MEALMNFNNDWPLPRPNTTLKIGREGVLTPVTEANSMAGTFSLLASPVMAEAVQRAHELRVSSDAEVFHQLRVAFRKLRALYWACAPLLSDQLTADAIAEFRRLAAVAGATRDWDIAGELLQRARVSGSSTEVLFAAVQEKRAQAVVLSQSTIVSAGIEALLSDVLRHSETTLQSCGNDIPVQVFAEQRVRLAERALNKRSRYAARQKTADEEDLHDVRKAGKKLRYLLEFFQPLIRGAHDRAIKKLSSAQDKLGQFNDLAASETLIRGASFSEVPPDVVQEALLWIEKQKDRRRRAASRRVRAIVA
jgi:CHAD domain-containing protein